MLFTRDLRVHDHPALAAAVREFEHVVPLFVLDDRLLVSPNRTAFLLESLADLRDSLGGALVVRRGKPVTEVATFDPAAVFLSSDVSPYALARERHLRGIAEVRSFPGVAVVDPGSIAPLGRDHYRVFTPYFRAWERVSRRALAKVPRDVRLPTRTARGRLPTARALGAAKTSPGRPRGGETEGRALLERSLRRGVGGYGEERDVLAAEGTSRLSPYLRFGCVSPLEAAVRAERRSESGPFVRQLAWRDFYLQLLRANPLLQSRDLNGRDDVWRDDPGALEAWQEGRTGIPVVDAGMRQLRSEGWMHNRARLLTASFLAKQLGVDWRLGEKHFFELLVDGDPSSNAGNWQWVAGTGTDTRPNRVFNPVVQARRFDPDGTYVRRYVPELGDVPVDVIHEPWRLGEAALSRLGYPPPLVEHADAAAAFLSRRRAAR